jgi:hypothetical protein
MRITLKWPGFGDGKGGGNPLSSQVQWRAGKAEEGSGKARMEKSALCVAQNPNRTLKYA